MANLGSFCNCCLLCGSEIIGDNGNGKTSKLKGIVGGVNCVSLERQLEKMFILIKVLEVPRDWCEATLMRGNYGGGGDNNPDKWFKLCDKCVEGNVKKAWTAYQNILRWQSNLLSVKLRIMEGMRQSILKNNQEKRRSSSQVEGEIKRYLFPELYVKVEQLEEAEGSAVNDDKEVKDYLNSLSVNENDHHQDLQDFQPEVTPKPTTKRGRGRPPKSPSKTRPLTYSYRGTLKTKRFHWSICTICDARYPNTEAYTAHMELHSQKQDNPSPSKGPLDCPHCPFPARDSQELDYHLRRRHSQKPPKLKQSYSCPKCPFTALRWKYFKEHVDSEHPTVPLTEFGSDLTLKCPDCGEQHVNIAQYQKHRHMKHPPDTVNGPVNCPHCSVKFLSGSLLAYHVNAVHKRASRHICDECGKGFEFGNALRRHKNGHLKKVLKRKREHVCEECGMDFYEKDSYNKHYKKQHGGGGSATRAPEREGLQAPVTDKMFQCKYCEVRSSLACFIKRHVQEEHRGEMAWGCDLCERRYTNQQGLKRHLRLNHGGAGEEVPCPHCGKRFKGEEYMRDHVKKFCKLKGVGGDDGGGQGGEGMKSEGGLCFTCN